MSARASGRRSDGLTGELFTGIPQPAPKVAGTMDYRKPVAQMVSDMLKAAPHTRYAIAARMSELADHETSKALLDSYTAETREASNLPLWKAPLMESACDSRALAEWHVGVLGGIALWGDEVLDADVGRRKRQVAQLQAEIKAIEQVQRRRR